MIYLLDTDIVIFMLRGLKTRANPNELQRQRHRLARRIFERAQKHKLDGDEVALSAITVAELEFGARTSGDYDREIDAVR
jgi:predicted nucleic acid-binding protein